MEINLKNLHIDILRRVKTLLDEFKTQKKVMDEYYRRLIVDVADSTSGEVRKKLIELIDSCKTGIIRVKPEVKKFLLANKSKLNKYSFENTYRMIKKIEKLKTEFTLTTMPLIKTIMNRLGNLLDKTNSENIIKKPLNNFYYVCNNYIKIVLRDKESDEIMEWLLDKMKSI